MNKHEKKFDKLAADMNTALFGINRLIAEIDKDLKKGIVGQHGVTITADDARLVLMKDVLKRAYRHIYEAERTLVVGWEDMHGDCYMPMPSYDKAEARNLMEGV